jgi:hypothetical protein
MHRSRRNVMAVLDRLVVIGSAGAAALGILTACGGGGGSADSPKVTITSPSDGADVGSSFAVKWDSSVKLGDTDTGRDHVHVFVDGHENDYTVVGGNSFTIKGLAPGEHTVDVTLQHADHSSAGAEDEVDVNVTGSGGAGQSPSPDDTESTDPGYGY